MQINSLQLQKKKTFDVSIVRFSSQFKRIEMETIILINQTVASNIERVVHRVDSASDKRRGRRDKKRGHTNTTRGERRGRSDELSTINTNQI